LGDEDRALFDAFAMIAGSDTLTEQTVDRIRAGNWPPGALRETIEEHARLFESMEDPYLRERADDIRNIGQRILIQLLEEDRTSVEYPQDTILVGDNLSPLDLAEVPVERLAGVVSSRGSGLSHLAILSRALGLPAVVGIGKDYPISRIDKKSLIVDGHQGRVYVDPQNSVRREFTRIAREERSLLDKLEYLRDLPAETVDGNRVNLYVNSGLTADFTQTESVGAEGVGLFRTELPFMVRDRFPTEEEQYILYREVLKKFAPRPVTLRTLDIGGDKSLPYFAINEDNPFLGLRGIRVSLDHPEIFLIQLRAMLRAGQEMGNLSVLFPMINCVNDLDNALALLHQSHQELNTEGIKVGMPRCGIMVEVPSAVYQVDTLVQKVDFLSIGTNDLIQYLLAVDRGNARVAKWYDSLHPAVLHAIKETIDAGKRYGKPVSVCGQAAGDPPMALLLVGMGVDSLSLSAADIPRVKWLIRSISFEQAQACLESALDLTRASSIRELLTAKLVDAGVGGLVQRVG
jgi:phosphotransferase system enzyme I (PtsP)